MALKKQLSSLNKILSMPLFKNIKLVIFSIFILGFLIRFLYFPGNVQFAYDQARDAFISLGILQGDFKLVGPPSTFNSGINHDPLFYYIAGPIYEISQKDPAGLSVFLRIYNLLGILLVFYLGKILFNKTTGIIAAFFYAVSFEQSQYAIFMSHPTMAVITILLFYLGFVLAFVKNEQSSFSSKNNPWGLIISAFGLGLSIHFHVGLIFLTPLFLIFPAILRFKPSNRFFKIIPLVFLTLGLTLSTFILAEIRYNFPLITGLLSLKSQTYSEQINILPRIGNTVFIVERFVADNIFNFGSSFLVLGLILLLVVFYIILKSKEYKKSGIFLLIWLIWGLLIYLYIPKDTYYYSIGTSVSIILAVAFILNLIFKKSRNLGIFILIMVFISNFNLIKTYNPLGPINAITSQDGMLLEQEKQIIDLTYQKAEGQPFAVNALTVPYNINTTWGYLYSWYGQDKYGYLPIWGGNHPNGYTSALIVNNSRSTLPEKRFLIVESTQGLLKHTIEDFLREEGYFTDVIEEIGIGKITLYIQKPK